MDDSVHGIVAAQYSLHQLPRMTAELPPVSGELLSRDPVRATEGSS
jgi:hypothetical protein